MTVARQVTVFVANTNLLMLEGLEGHIEGDAVNDATVTVTVRDSEGEEVAGASWPVAMEYVAASAGDYRALLSDGLSLTAGLQYTAVVDATDGADRVGHWEVLFEPYTRRGRTADT